MRRNGVTLPRCYNPYNKIRSWGHSKVRSRKTRVAFLGLTVLLAGCSGGGSPQLPTYPINGAFRQSKVASATCPGTASDSAGNMIACGSDYRMVFDSAAKTFRYFDQQGGNTFYQGTYYVLGTTLYLSVQDGVNTRIYSQSLRYKDPQLVITSKKADSSQIDLTFQRF